MKLSNEQHERIMRLYEARRLEAVHHMEERQNLIYKTIPRLREIEKQIASTSVRQVRIMLGVNGDKKESADEFKRKIKELSKEKAQLLHEQGWSESDLSEKYACERCHDTGYENGNRCGCFKQEISKIMYRQSNLEGVLEVENFDTFSFDYYSDEPVKELNGLSTRYYANVAYIACKNFVDNFEEVYQNILLYGNPGTGKTFLTHCIAREALKQMCSVLYFSAGQLFDIFKTHEFGTPLEKKEQPLKPIYECDLLIIDDLGTEIFNTMTLPHLFQCINERMLSKKPVVISTNFTLKELEEVYSGRVFSRLRSKEYTMLELMGNDIRKEKKLQQMGGND